MSIPKFVDKDYYVKVTESSMTDTILPSVLLGDFQETAEAGVGIYGIDNDLLNDHGYCWIVLRMSVDLDRFPKWKENFVIRTWSCGPGSLFWRRDYQLYDSAGNCFGGSTSEWIVADINTHAPIRPSNMIKSFSDIENAEYLSQPQNDLKAVDYSSPKLGFPKDQSTLGDVVISKYADYSELDHNHHVNNTRYIAWSYDALFKLGYDIEKFLHFDINYHSEVKKGEKVDIYSTEEDGFKYIYGYKNGSDKVFVFRCN